MMNKDDFKPADGVNLENALRYIEAVEETVLREFRKLPIGSRSMGVTLIAGTLRQASDRLIKFRELIESTGEASPITDEQREELTMLFRHAMDRRQTS